MEKYIIPTKAYVKAPLKERIFINSLKIILIYTILFSVLNMIFKGISLYNISIIVFAIYLIPKMKRFSDKSKYKDCTSEITFENDRLIIKYYLLYINNVFIDKIKEVNISDIKNLKYEKSIEILKINGTVHIADFDNKGNKNQTQCNEFLYFVDDTNALPLLSALQKSTGLTVKIYK
jgi:hypothetical protein